MNRSVFLSGLITVLFLAGCASAGQPTVDISQSSETPPLLSSDTPQPSRTPTIEPSSTITPIPSMTPTQPSPTPTEGLDSARVISVTENVNQVNLIFEIQGIRNPYNILLDKVQYFCVLVEEYPDRLFCNGLKKPLSDQSLALAFLDPESEEVAYETSILIPRAFVPTDVPVGDLSTWCPDRGKEFKCEYECRVAPDIGACFVATCYDACGYYYSINTCPADLAQPFTFCDGATLEAMKAKYNIP